MKFFKNLNFWGKIGLIFFLILNFSFIFMLFSPYIPNFIGEFRDNLLLEQCSHDIQKYRMGPIKIKLEYINGTPIENYNVSYNQLQHEFFFGCNIFSLDSFHGAQYTGYNESYKNYFKNLFNLAVLPFYWSYYEPQQGYFPMDSWLNNTINWCELNNITTKGHPIQWTRAIGQPDWLPSENNTLRYQLLENHTKHIVSKYNNSIQYWDSVNEPTHTQPFIGLSRQDYVFNSLKWASDSNSNGLFTINDYGILGHDYGGGPFYQLLNQLIQRNTPFQYIGFQSHEQRTDWIPATEIWGTLEAYSQLNKPIQITEFAPISSPVPITNSWKKGLWSELEQAEYARRFYTLCFSHPNINAIIWWDLCETNSWLEGSGLIRTDMTPKIVYTTLDQLINDDWHTSGSEITNSSGWVEFQGFFGNYNLSIQNDLYNYQISVDSDSNNEFLITI